MCVPEAETVSASVSVSVPVSPDISVSAVGRLLHFALKKKLVFQQQPPAEAANLA